MGIKILDSLFGKKSKHNNPTPSKTASSPNQPTSASQSKDRRIEPRLEVESRHGIEFYLLGNDKKVFTEVENISNHGLGFVVSKDTEQIQKDHIYEGVIKKSGKEILTKVHIMWVRGNNFGTRIEPMSEEFNALFSDFFQNELNALSIVKINPNIISKMSPGTPWWFKNLKGYEIFLVENQGQIVNFHLNLIEYYLESFDGKTITPYKIIDPFNRKVINKDLQRMNELSAELKEKIYNIVEKMDLMLPDQRNYLLNFFK